MSKKQVNFNTEWLMFVAGKGKVKLSLLTQPLSISVQVQYCALTVSLPISPAMGFSPPLCYLSTVSSSNK